MEGGLLRSGKEAALHPNSGYGRVSVDGHAVLANLGFNGRKAHGEACAMSIREGREYEFSCWMRVVDFWGSVSLRVADGEKRALSETAEVESSGNGGWTKMSAVVRGTSTGYGRLRKDLICALQDMKPSFLRFPGSGIRRRWWTSIPIARLGGSRNSRRGLTIIRGAAQGFISGNKRNPTRYLQLR